MRVLVVGNGGREHALVWKIKQSPQVDELFCAPGNAGIEALATGVPLSATDVDGLVRFVSENQIDLTVIGPEASLLAGVVDALEAEGHLVFGPNRQAAQVEGSKRFAKELMESYGIPTGRYRSFDDSSEALRYIREQGAPIVIKADGLAAGKGVVVARTLQEATDAVHHIMEERAFGDAGTEIVVEEFLEGQEMSLMAFVDGETVVPMVPAQDHKPVFNGDQGPNTGGMGAYSPVPQIPDSIVHRAVTEILEPMVKGMAQSGLSYRGVLYAGLMITADGPKVIEFNARFGDPETQVVLPRLESDLVDVLLAVAQGHLSKTAVVWKKEAACCVVVASGGYPGSYEKGKPIEGLSAIDGESVLFHAGTARKNGAIVTAGGRVLGVTAWGADLKQARTRAYDRAETIRFEGAHYRTDIGSRAIDSK
ncbi:phosphoribosylamine--glycine ligase [Desmospora profundinema]|uniref:Phosphoribosylamine--glycine ligase n=1 Tax=Desmospora profundinema TaxID=1571184 RepID=A0ABU1IM60_9BACL|nr:phosphoribosylamine--glycine ligase [Desmospora profundinema]MDR6225875.1 phosphoribosylamine--glycine ligase [Desmospora profundinema]